MKIMRGEEILTVKPKYQNPDKSGNTVQPKKIREKNHFAEKPKFVGKSNFADKSSLCGKCGMKHESGKCSGKGTKCK